MASQPSTIRFLPSLVTVAVVAASALTQGTSFPAIPALRNEYLGQSVAPLLGTTTHEYLHRGLTRGLEAWVAGEEVASLGDICSSATSATPDGIRDFIVGNRTSNCAQVYSGRPRYRWAGAGTPASGNFPFYDGTFDRRFSLTLGSNVGASPTAWFGFDVADAFDVDGDGVHDFIVSAPRYDAVGNDPETGLVRVYSGATGNVLCEIVPATSSPLRWFGWSVAGLGDVDADGRGDIAISAVATNGYAGRVVVILGRVLACNTTLTLASTPPSGVQYIDPPSPFSQSFGGFGVVVAAGGRSGTNPLGPQHPDRLLVGEPGYDVLDSNGSIAASEVGAFFVYQFDPGANAVANSQLPCSTPTCPNGAFVVQPFNLGTGVGLVGVGACANLGFDASTIGSIAVAGSVPDAADEILVGAMGQSPNGSCSANTYTQDGYTILLNGATLGVLEVTAGTTQNGERERYGAYVAGDTQLDGTASCDLDGDGVNDFVVSSYRRKLDGTNDAERVGAATTYSGSVAATGTANYASLRLETSFLYDSLVLGHGTMDGRSEYGAYGEALAMIPRLSSADWPRLAASEFGATVDDPCAPTQAGEVGTPSIVVTSVFGAAVIEEAGLPVDRPAMRWTSGPVSGWLAGDLHVTLSSTASSAAFVAIVPSATMVADSVPTAPNGIGPRTYPGHVTGGSPAIDYPIYTLFSAEPPPVTANFTSWDSTLATQRLDFSAAEWLFLQGVGVSTVGTTVGSEIVLPFSLDYSVLPTQYPDSHFENHPVMLANGGNIYLQVIEFYGDPTNGWTIKASDLVIVRGHYREEEAN